MGGFHSSRNGGSANCDRDSRTVLATTAMSAAMRAATRYSKVSASGGEIRGSSGAYDGCAGTDLAETTTAAEPAAVVKVAATTKMT